MRQFYIILLILLSSFRCAVVDSRELGLHTVGELQIGMSADDIYSMYGEDRVKLVDLFLEALYSPALEIRENGTTSIVAELECGNVWRMNVYSKLYKTTAGIGIGSAYVDLKNSYPDTEILYSEHGIFAHVESLKMSFALNETSLKNAGITYDTLSKDIIPDETMIDWILVL